MSDHNGKGQTAGDMFAKFIRQKNQGHGGRIPTFTIHTPEHIYYCLSFQNRTKRVVQKDDEGTVELVYFACPIRRTQLWFYWCNGSSLPEEIDGMGTSSWHQIIRVEFFRP